MRLRWRLRLGPVFMFVAVCVNGGVTVIARVGVVVVVCVVAVCGCVCDCG